MAGCSMFVNLIVYIEEAKREEAGKKETHQITKNFRYLKWRNPEPSKAILGVGFPLHKPYPYSGNIGEDSSILGTERNVW